MKKATCLLEEVPARVLQALSVAYLLITKSLWLEIFIAILQFYCLFFFFNTGRYTVTLCCFFSPSILWDEELKFPHGVLQRPLTHFLHLKDKNCSNTKILFDLR